MKQAFCPEVINKRNIKHESVKSIKVCLYEPAPGIKILTRLSVENTKRVIGKQCRLRSDAASDQGLHYWFKQ